MTETPEEAIAVMRQASEVVSKVLPSALAELVYDELLGNIDAVLHGSTPQLQWVAREVLALADPGGIRPGSVELTPEQVEEFKARFEALKKDPPTLLGLRGVTREQVRAAAHALFLWNNALPGDPRFVLHHVPGAVDREPYGALVDEVLHHLGITAQEGRES